MVVKQSSNEIKEARLSLRLHTDLEAALEFLAAGDHRKLAAYVELVLREHVAGLLTNTVLIDGRMSPAGKFHLRTPNRYR